ncbi:hypothetical protein ACGFNU_49925 [Spirillospora sp. NPDC048911]|uniref:hypothetical protein n=1 Tax=Spirillospora sp. NPDC048911 TaxID=3364527 RepID=UPI003720F84A
MIDLLFRFTSRSEMITIKDKDLIATDGPPATFGRIYAILQAEFELAVFSGVDTVVITTGKTLATLLQVDPVTTETLPPFDEDGFEGVIQDLHLSRVFVGWTTEHGGTLRLRVVFEGEGVEVRGGVADIDFDYLHLDIFMIPSLDASGTVVWTIDRGIEIDFKGGLSGALRELIERKVLESPLAASLAESLDGLRPELNRLLELPLTGGISSIDVDEGEAHFDNVQVGQRRIDVVFDAVEIHDDTDGSGQGELTFAATVEGIDTGFSATVNAGSGTLVPLEGPAWRIGLTVQDEQPVSMRFEALDTDPNRSESLGVINIDLDTGTVPVVLRLDGPGRRYTVLMRLVVPGVVARPPNTRHLRVSVPSATVERDLDTSGKGEVQFWALIADQPTAVSVEQKVKGTDNPEVTLSAPGGGPLEVELFLPGGEPLEMRVVGWDNDPGQRDWMGDARLTIPGDAIVAGSSQVESDSADFIATIEIVDLDEPVEPASPPTVRRLVIFDSLTVRNGPGTRQILATATANGVDLGNTHLIDTSSGTTVPLAGSQWRGVIAVPVDEALDLAARVVDSGQDLGEALLTLGVGDDYGLGSHTMVGPDGRFEFRLHVLDAAVTLPRLVVFESLTIPDDHDWGNAGEILATATAGGIVMGDTEPIDVSSGTTLPLVGGSWRKEIAVIVGGTLDLTVKVVDVDGGDDDPLSEWEMAWDADGAYGLGSHTLGDSAFEVRLRILDPAQDTGDVQATVRLEKVEILDDHTAVGPGEFWGIASVNDFPVGSGDRLTAGRGDTIVLDSAQWSHWASLDEGEPLEVSFEVVEAADDDHVSLGTATAHLTYPWPAGTQVAASDEGDFLLHYRAYDTVPTGANQLNVTFLEITVLDDGDSASEGELRFSATANNEESGLSVLQKARREEPLLLMGELWTLQPRLAATDRLTIGFSVYDEDGDTLKLLDQMTQRFTLADDWGLGDHTVTSPDERFRIRYTIAGTDAESLPDLPRRYPLLVEFTSVQVDDDGDNADRGEVSFTGRINGTTVLQTPEYKVRSGDTVPLGEPLAPRMVWAALDQDLTIELTASERDNGDDTLLGTSRRVHRFDDGWDIGSHEVRAPGSAITSAWRIDAADGPRMRVKFLQVDILKDHEPAGRGELICQGQVNDVSTGPSLEMKAGKDDSLFLGGPKWRKIVSYSTETPKVDITFTVTDRDGLSGDDLLGTVRYDATDILHSEHGFPSKVYEVPADTDRFTLFFLVQKLA